MAITEIVTVSVNPDPANLEHVEKIFPGLKKYFTDPNPGILSMFRGWALEVEWNEAASFHNFIGSDKFKEFAGLVKPFVLGPPELQLFETNQSPTEPASSPVVEIYRVSVASDKVSEARAAWEDSVQKLNAKAGVKAKLTHGKSLNLQEDVVLGILGWESLEERDNATDDPEFMAGLDRLRALGNLSEAVVEFDCLI
ncbi:hypothetical protein N7468_006550 [Penicillium chermesinum]|uniref:Uncharacterized protein n=1 Tax=Penicillium chermesinum TaxID=63820 RepID=A0A9W9NSI6_9EURO|nr:uncharacterized protein N7468_006550 [Penicillium chermesinum]KAJ5225325.1 hypothetical protein N7468_006550 [Penicillium chermesinum]KAJ6161448.1 hypothetical protein N7470_004844 [Penicillium chermesinum]